MPDPATQALPRKTRLYVLSVVSLGALVVGLSVSDVIHQPSQWHLQWLTLVGLTVGSGLLPVTLPSINISISISETFVVAGTLLFGASGGTVLVLLDALFISLRLFFTRRLRWEQIAFNLAASPLALWTAAQSARIEPLFQTDQHLGWWFLGKLFLFVGIYFLLNSWLLAVAIALATASQAVQHLVEILQRFARQLWRRRIARRSADLQHADGRSGFRCDHLSVAACPVSHLSVV